MIRFPKDGRVHFTHVRCRILENNIVEFEDVTTGQRYQTQVEGDPVQFIRETFGLEPLQPLY